MGLTDMLERGSHEILSHILSIKSPLIVTSKCVHTN